MGILGVLQYYKEGHVDFKVVIILAIGFLAGSYFGSKIALSLPQETVKKIFAILLMIVAIKMLFIDKPQKEETPDHKVVPDTSSLHTFDFLSRKIANDKNKNESRA